MAAIVPPRIVQSVTRAARSEIRASSRRRKLRRDVVFLESFDGNGALCNPEAIFRALAADPAFTGFRFVWSLRPGHEGDLVLREFVDDPRVTFVVPGSAAYVRAVSSAGFVVTNATLPRWFSRRAGQIVLNTWHGTPLKKMGFDIDDQPARVANVLRNFLHADFLLSSGSYMTETMYIGAHRLDGLYDGTVLELGSPRVDAQFAGPEVRARTGAALRNAGIDPVDRQLVLYAPTWKGANFTRPLDDALALLEQARWLQELLGDGFRVALKAHQAVHESVRGRGGAGVLVPNDLPTNAVLAVTDQLVTDYSSIFFDFLTLDRPIHFFVPDLRVYDGYRGLYQQPDTWPGSVATTLDDVAASIRAPQDAATVERARAARERFAANEDGAATGRIVDAVFCQNVPGTAIRLNRDARPRRVLVAGGPPGTWDAPEVDRACARVDLDAVDLTVVVSDSRRSDFIAWQKSLDRRIRVVVRQGEIGGSKVWALLERAGLGRPRALWQEEWVRLFGLSRIDAVTCVGTGAFWRSLAAAGAASSTSGGQGL